MGLGTRIDQRLRLADGRWLGFAEYGDPHGTPVLQFHGLPGSRLVASSDGELAAAGVRLIGVDRPGYGLSDFQPGRALRHWPRDVVALADALGIDKFSILGGSAGGPYALVCAHDIADRLLRVAVVNSMAPLDRPAALRGFRTPARLAWWSLANLPGQRHMFAWSQRRMLQRHPERFLGRMAAAMADQDRQAITAGDMRASVLAHIAEAYRSGWRGVAHDMRVLTSPWGFEPRDIGMRVHLWQGEDDQNVPPAMGRYLAFQIPDCDARFLREVGHLVAGSGAAEVLAILTAGDRADAS
ncbi:MAG: alpha/beta fold hydrolase [Anaerolineae bacterium]